MRPRTRAIPGRARLIVTACALVVAGPVAAAAQETTTTVPSASTTTTTARPTTTAPTTTAPASASSTATSIPPAPENPPPPLPPEQWPDVIVAPPPPVMTAELEALLASDAEIRARMMSLTGELATKKAELAATEKEAAEAEAAHEKAERQAAAARRVAERTEAEVKEMAVDAYLHPPAERLATVMISSSIEEALQRQSMLSIRAEQRADLLDRRREALADVEDEEAAAAKAEAEASSRREEQRAAVAAMEVAQSQQASMAAALEHRLEASLAESAALSSLDADLARQLGEQQLALYRDAGAAGLAGGFGDLGPPVTRSGGVQVTKVGPFWVNVAIARQVQAMLAAFATTGHTLGGGAYRDPAAQIQLRISHCGPTLADIYTKPSSSCSPPTARPGHSMHELGLALDLQCDGKLIGTRSNFCFMWLAVNAANYGLYNLPSEPWHWSVNGN